MQLRAKIIGVTNRNHDGTNRQDILYNLRAGDRLLLYDLSTAQHPDMIGVFTQQNEQCGFLEPSLSTRILDMEIDIGAVVVHVLRITRAEDLELGCTIEINLPQDADVPLSATPPARRAATHAPVRDDAPEPGRRSRRRGGRTETPAEPEPARRQSPLGPGLRASTFAQNTPDATIIYGEPDTRMGVSKRREDPPARPREDPPARAREDPPPPADVPVPGWQFYGGNALAGWMLLGCIVTVVTLGLGYAWATCKCYRWRVEHTTIEGRRLEFTGSTRELFARYIKWWLLTIVTLGIYGLWANMKVNEWKVRHTRFGDNAGNAERRKRGER